MGMYDLDPPTCPERPVRDEQRLAAQVLRVALVDALGPHPVLALDARAFLSGGPDLTFWSRIAGLDPHVVRTLAARTLADPGAGRWVGLPWALRAL